MIDPQWIASQPASKFAAECLQRLRLPANPRATPLLDLVTNWLDSRPKAAFHGTSSYLGEMQTAAHQLALLPPEEQAIALLVDPEGFYRELEANPPQEQALLADHLQRLLNSLREAKSPSEAAQMLAENLFQSLQAA